MSHVERRGLSFLRDALRLVAMSSPQESSPALDYAQPSPQERRHQLFRQWTRRILWCALATVVMAIGWRVATQVQYLYWQHQCLTYALPPSTIVFDCFHRKPSAPPHARWLLDEKSDWAVFIHGRETPAGERRLVIAIVDRNDTELSISAEQYIPATLMLKSIATPMRRPFTACFVPRNTKVYAGQPDPSDPTHFTIECDLQGQRKIIDGWVLNNGEVKVELRDPTAGRQ